jgi:uncharacterized protein (DUF1800 family)
MDAAATVARLHRRAGFGLAASERAAALQRGVDAEVARLLDPAAAGIPEPDDAWTGVDLTFIQGQVTATAVEMVHGWIGRMVATPRPLEERMAWFWHGHFVSALSKVRLPLAMATQIRLFQNEGLGSFPALVKAVTVDPAMLLYLDGTTSTGAAPNENYGREVLELFTLGRGNYAEADVHAGAAALTGWHVDRADPSKSAFAPRRHDDSPQTYLDTPGVHEVDSVVAAITARPACASFIAAKIGRAILGANIDGAVVTDLADRFTVSGLDVRALLTATLEKLVSGVDGGGVVLAPVPWLVMALRATGATLAARPLVAGLRAAGQVPLLPPNVGGWPSGDAWYGSATVVSRFDLAVAVAMAAPADNPAVVAAGAGDAAGLAAALGLPAPFGPATSAALRGVTEAQSRLVIALTSPEFVVA